MMRLHCIVNYYTNFIINTEIKIKRENRKFSLILERHKGRPWLLAVSGWAGSPGVRLRRAGMKVSWGVQRVTHNCHPALWRRRGKTQQPKAQVQSKQVLQVRMVKPDSDHSVSALILCGAQHLCRRLFNPNANPATHCTYTGVLCREMGVKKGLCPSPVTFCDLV